MRRDRQNDRGGNTRREYDRVSQSAAGRGHIDLQENPSQGNETDAKRAAGTAESPPRRSTSQRYLLRDDISALAPCDVVQCHLIIVGRKPRLTN
ncbi:MAG: hypothetical protein DMG04_05720 [Acidobacteria bacterium]|nr:MAG: hypothetical protein DMG04_05720 [Acidobacteriota bacterium]PYQ81642.1 MAG: hypothetical protein DMG03_19455 [Acidobacteriota bacterium]